MTDDEIIAELSRDTKLSRIWQAIHHHALLMEGRAGLTTIQQMRLEFITAQAIFELLQGDKATPIAGEQDAGEQNSER